MCEPPSLCPTLAWSGASPLSFGFSCRRQAHCFGKTSHENVSVTPTLQRMGLWGAGNWLVWDLIFRNTYSSEMGYFEQMFVWSTDFMENRLILLNRRISKAGKGVGGLSISSLVLHVLNP